MPCFKDTNVVRQNVFINKIDIYYKKSVNKIAGDYFADYDFINTI